MVRQSLKSLSQKRLEPEDAAIAINALNSESDRGLALIGAAFIEKSLRIYITQSMRKGIGIEDQKRLFEGTGPLSGLSAMLLVAHGFGLLPHTLYLDLQWVRDIRNAFAHSMLALSFETEEIKAACNQLEFAAKRRKRGVPSTSRDTFKQTIMHADLWLIFKSSGHNMPDDYLDRSMWKEQPLHDKSR